MKFLKVQDVKERLPELLTLMANDPKEEILLMDNQEPVFRISRIADELTAEEEKNLRTRGFGIARDKFKLPPDFDEAFTAMDKEIWKLFMNEEEVRK